MQILVVYDKQTRKVIATFELNSISTEINGLVIPGLSYLVSYRKDIFHTAQNGDIYVKNI